MIIETAIRTELLTDATLAGLVGSGSTGRIYYTVADKDVTKPYIVLSKVSGYREHSHQGASGLAHPSIQLFSFATTYAGAKALAVRIQAVLQGYSGTLGGVGGVAVNGCTYDDEVDDYDPETSLYNVAQTFSLWCEE
jgi:hypothetical protein